MFRYIEAAPLVNSDVDHGEVEIPPFLPRRPQQAAAARPRRRISPAAWSTVRARIAREHEGLPEDSPRRRSTLPRLRLLGEPEEAA